LFVYAKTTQIFANFGGKVAQASFLLVYFLFSLPYYCEWRWIYLEYGRNC